MCRAVGRTGTHATEEASGRCGLFLLLGALLLRPLDERPLHVGRLLVLVLRGRPLDGGSGGAAEGGTEAAGAGAGSDSTRSALVTASRSKRSEGSLTRMPPGASVPSTGPLRCWITWVSS